MSWALGVGTGFGVGLLFFGGLWWSVRGLRSRKRPALSMLATRTALLLLVGATLYALAIQEGRNALLAALAGLLTARTYVVRTVGRKA